MSIIGSNILAGAAGSGVSAYEIEQSLRFNNESENVYLSKTFSSDGNRKKWTWSAWIKLGRISDEGHVFEAYAGSGDIELFMRFNSNDSIRFGQFTTTGYDWKLDTTAKFRDPSAWYHVVLVFDSDNATSSDRARIYVNGERITAFDSPTYPGSGSNAYVNKSGYPHYLCNSGLATRDFGGYLAEVNFIDGTAVTDALDFGEYDDNGVWRPIKYAGSYTGNSFYLKFDAADVDGDSSGLGNDWTASAGISTSGIGTDVMSDTPTTNWCTLNPLITHSGTAGSYENGNLTRKNSTNVYFAPGFSSIAVASGKWYFECNGDASNYLQMGFVDTSQVADVSSGYAFRNPTRGWAYQSLGLIGGNGDSYIDNTPVAANSSGDVIGCAVDFDSGSAEWYVNGTQTGATLNFSSYLATERSWYLGVAVTNEGTDVVDVNFGQREFAYPPGTVSATDYFNTVLYTGTGASLAVTGVGFQPDFVWIKNRGRSGSDSCIVDVVRGATKSLSSDNTNAEITFNGTDDFVSFDSDGFSLGTSSNLFVNSLNDTHVAFCWKAGGTASANTDGDIDSSVSASTDAAFSVFTYTGNGGTDQTVGHGLGVTPSFCIVKSRASNSWFIRHNSLGSNKNLNFNSSGAVTPGGGGLVGDLSSTSTITLKSGSNNADNINANGTNYVAYCWADKDGVTKTGSYTGTGTQGGGLYVECGFKPAMVIVKGDATASWQIIDNKRGDDVAYFPDSDGTENERSDRQILFVQSGFLVQGNDGNINTSGTSYYFIAFASNLAVDADFKSLNTANLPAPTVKDGSKNFDTTLYTGNSAARTISTNSTFTPDFIWIKGRSGAYNHSLQDVVRGFASGKAMGSNLTSAESGISTQAGYVDGVGAGTFDLNADATATWYHVNVSGQTYVAWNWLAGGSGSSNTDGSITSTVSANPSAGFSIATYSANNTAGATFGHGLGVAPSMVIIKKRNATERWVVYHQSISNQYIYLNETFAGETANAALRFGNDSSVVAPSSTLVTIGTSNDVNGASGTYVAYCFAEVEGYSKFGSYVGNDNSSGPFVYTGFRPAWVMVKSYSSGHAYNWVIVDAARNTYNVMNGQLFPNESNSESTGVSTVVDFLSNGFKWRFGSNGFNGSSVSYIFAAFSENPFGGSGVSPATAR
jgi:hypothetical protein